MSKELFVGTWKLISSEMRTASGNIHHPFGEDCTGIMMFDTANYMAGHIMRRGRPDFASGDIMRGTDEEIRAAYQGYVAFWATYIVDEATKTMTYTVVGSLCPNWIGDTNDRSYEFDGDLLTLKTTPFLAAGEDTTGILIWERVC
jgi:hypothetical protein